MFSRLTRPTVSSQQKVVPKKPYTGTGKTHALLPKFDWRVNEEFGYFELGTPARDDDFYIFNTTLVSCEYFHLLWDGDDGDQLGEDSFWTIQYAAFGCNIVSDPFVLSGEKDGRRTFIGDKATARIRCNGALFHQYLNSTSLEFRVLRSTGAHGHQGVSGVSFAELKGLTKVDVKGLKATLEIVPYGDYGTTVSDFGSLKPELRIVIELSVIPSFFSRPDCMVAVAELPMSPGLTELKQAEENLTEEPETETHDDETQTDGNSSPASAVPPQPQPITIDIAEEEASEEESDDEQVEIVMARGVPDLETSSVTESSGDPTLFESSKSPNIILTAKDQSPRVATRRAEGGDSLDGVGMSHKPVAPVVEAPVVEKNLVHNMENNSFDWAGEAMVKFKTEFREKERAYLKILADEWIQRDSEREARTSQVIQEHAIMKQKIELKELQLNEKETSFIKRERELEDSANRTTFDLTQRLEDSKLRMGRMKDQYQSDIDLFMAKVETAEAEIRRLNGKVQSLEAKLCAKEEEMDRLNATRSQWPDMNLERKAMQLEEKNASLKVELERVRRERDTYRTEAYTLAHRQNQLQCQREAQVWNENEVLRAQLLMNQQRKDLKEERESVKEVTEKIEALKQALSKRDTQTNEANLSGNSDKRIRSPSGYAEATSPGGVPSPVRVRINQNSYTKYLNPSINAQVSSMSPSDIDFEITRLVGERDRLIGTGTYLRTDPVIRDIDNALTRLASDLMARNNRIPGY